jgi:hypothetical protein
MMSVIFMAIPPPMGSGVGSGVMDHTPDQSDASHGTNRKTAFGLPDVRDPRGDAFPSGPRSRGATISI